MRHFWGCAPGAALSMLRIERGLVPPAWELDVLLNANISADNQTVTLRAADALLITLVLISAPSGAVPGSG